MRNLDSNKKGKRPMTKRMQGFTLVEIAIVLVIIGLLLGGILKGQEMTTPAPVAGDGNGIVAGTYNNGGATCTTAVESCSWWDHLRKAGFVSGNGAQQPFNAVTGQIG